ncbi:MAG: protein jag [Clostridia bacterium]|nr:protein jag [Clostridia bacterium]
MERKEITVKAKTVEEAVAQAAAELGVAAEDVEYKVTVEPKRGFLGIGATEAEITATFTPRGEKNALDFIKTVVDDMQLEAEITSEYNDEGDFCINVNGESVGVLIGHHGDTLDSLQYLVNLAANRRDNGVKHDFIRVNLDVEGYRAKREETLRVLARRSAEKVLKYKKSVMMEPMSPYERRIIHSEIQLIPGVSTNSIGSENNRKIVVYLDAAKTVD